MWYTCSRPLSHQDCSGERGEREREREIQREREREREREEREGAKEEGEIGTREKERERERSASMRVSDNVLRQHGDTMGSICAYLHLKFLRIAFKYRPQKSIPKNDLGAARDTTTSFILS